MRPELPRRTVLAAGAATLLPAVAGCTGGDEESTPDPDEGRDSYGIHVLNDTKVEHVVRTRVEQPWEETTIFEEVVTIGAGESRTWHQVITEETDHAIVAELDDVEDDEPSTTWVDPGNEESPPDAHVLVHVNKQPGVLYPFTSVYFESTVED